MFALLTSDSLKGVTMFKKILAVAGVAAMMCFASAVNAGVTDSISLDVKESIVTVNGVLENALKNETLTIEFLDKNRIEQSYDDAVLLPDMFSSDNTGAYSYKTYLPETVFKEGEGNEKEIKVIIRGKHLTEPIEDEFVFVRKSFVEDFESKMNNMTASQLKTAIENNRAVFGMNNGIYNSLVARGENLGELYSFMENYPFDTLGNKDDFYSLLASKAFSASDRAAAEDIVSQQLLLVKIKGSYHGDVSEILNKYNKDYFKIPRRQFKRQQRRY